MTLTGQFVHERIKNTVAGLELQHDNFNSEIYSYEGKINALAEERETRYSTLATVYLPEMDARSIEATLKEVQATVQGIFLQKQNRRKRLDELLGTARNERALLEEKLDMVTENLNTKVAEREALEKTIAEELYENPDYRGLDEQAGQAKQGL